MSFYSYHVRTCSIILLLLKIKRYLWCYYFCSTGCWNYTAYIPLYGRFELFWKYFFFLVITKLLYSILYQIIFTPGKFSTSHYISCSRIRGTQRDILRKRPKNNEAESFMKPFWETAGKNLSVPHSQQDWWKSSQPARCTYNLQPDLLESFPADIYPDITGQFGGRGVGVLLGQWVWLKDAIHPFSAGVGGRFLTNNTWELFYTSNTLRHPQLSFSQQHVPSKDILLLPHLPASKNMPEEQIFWGPDPLGAPVE